MPFQKGKSGNPKGRPRKPEIEEFKKALQKVEKEADYSLLEHAVREAYKHENVLIALLKKILPDKVHEEISLDEINSQIDQVIKIVLRYCPIDARDKIIKELQK